MAKRTPAPAQEIPAFASDRLRLLAPLITPRVMELALMRFSDGNAFIKSGKLVVPDDKQVVKVALIVHSEMNPLAELDFEEEALLAGCSSKALREHRAAEIEQLRMQMQRLVFRKTS